MLHGRAVYVELYSYDDAASILEYAKFDPAEPKAYSFFPIDMTFRIIILITLCGSLLKRSWLRSSQREALNLQEVKYTAFLNPLPLLSR